MPDALPAISARQVAGYMSCARRFYLAEIEHQEPPYRPSDALVQAIQEVVYELLVRRDMTDQEMYARYDAAFAGARTLCRVTASQIAPFESRGKRLLTYFRNLELPSMNIKAIKPKFEREAQVEDFKFKLTSQPSLMEPSQLGHFRIVNRNYSKRELYSDLEIVLSSFSADCFNAYAIVFVWEGEALHRHTTTGFGGYPQWALLCAAEALRGIESGRFPPCDPITWYCRRGACRWYDKCGRGGKGKRGR